MRTAKPIKTMKKYSNDQLPNKFVIGHQVHDAGDGLQTLIFIHGFPFNYTSWQPQIDHFKDSYRVIAYDIRGFGSSSINTEAQSIQLMADDLVAIMDELKIEKAAVCGLSMGGYIALNAISRYADRFSGLILCDTQCGADTTEARDKRFKTIDHISKHGLEGFAVPFIEALFGSETYRSNPELVQSIRDMVMSANIDTVKATLKALAERGETCSILADINVPALLIFGSEDKITPPHHGSTMQAQIPNAILETIEGAGHLSNLENPRAFNDILERFMIRNFSRTLL
jgi:pimeloyl-ACP methyl ester carboxylesterase